MVILNYLIAFIENYSIKKFFFHIVIYNKFLVPNNLTEDEEFLANDAVPTILEALR